MRVHFHRPLAVLMCVSACEYAYGQSAPTETTSVRIFDTQYFAEFSPINAAELVANTPGFTLIQESGVRGLGNVRVNVLIDGQRTPPKGRSVSLLLSDIPVGEVSRLELIQATANTSLDMQGFSQILNVITKPPARPFHEVDLRYNRAGTGEIEQDNSDSVVASFYRRDVWANHSYSVRFNVSGSTLETPSGFESIDPNNPVQRVTSLSRFESTDYGAVISDVIDFGSDRTLNFNFSASRSDNQSNPLQELSPTSGLITTRRANSTLLNRHNFSAEYESPISARWAWTIAVVDRATASENSGLFVSENVQRSSLRETETRETAGRTSLEWTQSDDLTVRFNSSIALNSLLGNLVLHENGVQQVIEGSKTDVEELRGNADIAYDWSPLDALSIQASAGLDAYEVTSLTASSDQTTAPNGKLLVSYELPKRTILSFETKHEVGQLSFNQFLASAALDTEIVTAGAVDLDPERTTRHSLKFDRRFADRGQFTLEARREIKENPIRISALSASVLVAQNTSSTETNSLFTNFRLPLSRIGLKDIDVIGSGRVADSSTRDPVTGQSRSVSNSIVDSWSLRLQKDRGDDQFAWSLGASGRNREPGFSARTISFRDNPVSWDASFEWVPNKKLRFEIDYTSPRSTSSDILIFSDTRTETADPAFIQRLNSQSGEQIAAAITWKLLENVELSATLNSGRERNTRQNLFPFGTAPTAPQLQFNPATPRFGLRFRITQNGTAP